MPVGRWDPSRWRRLPCTERVDLSIIGVVETLRFELSGAQRALQVRRLPISLNFAVCARVRGAFTSADLQHALERLRRRHPLLAVRFAPPTDHLPACLTTRDVPPVPLRVEELSSDETWVGEVEREIARPSDYATGPLFRCVWLRGADFSDLLLICDHITADGFAGIYALQDLLALLADPDRKPEPLLPPRLAELIPPAMRSRIQTLVSSAPEAGPVRPDDRLRTLAEAPLRIHPFALSEVETEALVAHCRAHGVTVQAALCAVFGRVFAEREPGAPRRRIESPVNLRNRLLQPVGEAYGNYISLVYSELDCAPERDIWDIARQATQSLAGVTEEQLFTVPIVMMAVADRPLPMPVIHHDYDISISNLGRVSIPVQYGTLRLESIYAPIMNVSHPGHRILGVTTFRGAMRCTFTSRDPNALSILRRARQLLDSLL